MAIRARLAAPPPQEARQQTELRPEWMSLPSQVFWHGDRRMEAETYLASGYGLRASIEGRTSGWQRLAQLARVWQPSRLKGVVVGAEFGTPFLAATQVFDIRAVPRKWLALARTDNAADRFVNGGTIVVTCSGAVGRATLAHDTHANMLISHDLLRVDARKREHWGWLYAYLRSRQARAMMTSAQYGHMIKHLETSHLDVLPVPVVNGSVASAFEDRARAILDLRNRAYGLALKAEERFEDALGSLTVRDWGEGGFEARASRLSSGRRRLEAAANNPGVAAIRDHLKSQGRGVMTVAEAGFNVWLPARFKRIPAEGGVELVDSSAVFEVSPDHQKRIADGDFGDAYNGRVKAGWLLMARSGQTYGINGNVAFATLAHENRAVSDDLLRIAPLQNAVVRPGYLYVALSHPRLGRPLVKALAYGSSIPHIEVADLLAFEFVRLSAGKESAIADLAEEAAAERARADLLERELAVEAEELIDRFLAGDISSFVAVRSLEAASPALRYAAVELTSAE